MAKALGRHRNRPAAGRAVLGATGLCFFAGLPAPMLLFPIPKLRSRSQSEGRNVFPSPAL